MGQTPLWVMRSFDIKQLGLLYQTVVETEMDFTELQARMVWAVGGGWKRPIKVEDALGVFERMGALVEQ